MDSETETRIEGQVVKLSVAVAHIQSDVTHLQSDMTEVKAELRTLRDKADALKESISSAKVWALLLYIALAASLFGTLAHGFKWI